MYALSDTTLLQLWDSGCAADPVERALLLLGLASPALGHAERIEVDIGTRDEAILRLRQATIGEALSGSVHCPRCRARLEFEIDGDCLLPDQPTCGRNRIKLGSGMQFRLPTSADLLAVACCGDEDEAAADLARRCCLNAADDRGWNADELADLDTQLMALQAAAATELALACAACGHAWSEQLDISAFFWAEIEHRAQRLLDDVHRLAWSYGWSERHILMMSRPRRAAYLERCDP
jgi:hypothetical protein